VRLVKATRLKFAIAGTFYLAAVFYFTLVSGNPLRVIQASPGTPPLPAIIAPQTRGLLFGLIHKRTTNGQTFKPLSFPAKRVEVT